MSSEDEEVYVLRAADDEWERPRPVGSAIADAMSNETDIHGDDIDSVESYVDPAKLRAVIDGEDDAVTFTVEGYEVTLSADGGIDVCE